MTAFLVALVAPVVTHIALHLFSFTVLLAVQIYRKISNHFLLKMHALG